MPGREFFEMKKLLTLIGFCGLSIISAAWYGCSTPRMASRAMGPVIENTRDFALASPDVETFMAAAPSSLFLIEGLLESDPGNYKLSLTASMLYFSYAFAGIEEENESYASYLYLRGLVHARHALFGDETPPAGWDAGIKDFASLINSIESDKNPAAVWAAANWVQFINLHLDSTAVLPDIPKVVLLLEKTSELDGGYFEGLSYIMLGSLHAFRPKAMGGNPQASKECFKKAFEISQGTFLLGKYFYAKYYCYRIQDAAEFEKSLLEILSKNAAISPRFRLLNALAKEKASTLLENKDDIF